MSEGNFCIAGPKKGNNPEQINHKTRSRVEIIKTCDEKAKSTQIQNARHKTAKHN